MNISSLNKGLFFGGLHWGVGPSMESQSHLIRVTDFFVEITGPSGELQNFKSVEKIRVFVYLNHATKSHLGFLL